MRVTKAYGKIRVRLPQGSIELSINEGRELRDKLKALIENNDQEGLMKPEARMSKQPRQEEYKPITEPTTESEPASMSSFFNNETSNQASNTDNDEDYELFKKNNKTELYY